MSDARLPDIAKLADAVEEAWDRCDEYWDADVSEKISIVDSPCAIDHAKITADGEANDMHEAVVRELTNWLRTHP